MTEFKGTKGKWHKQQNRQGDIEISAIGFENLATVSFYPKGFREKYINGKITGSPAPDSTQFRRECIYNAKLIVKAPEMLEMLEKLVYEMQIKDSSRFRDVKRLIKEATEL